MLVFISLNSSAIAAEIEKHVYISRKVFHRRRSYYKHVGFEFCCSGCLSQTKYNSKFRKEKKSVAAFFKQA